MWDPPWEGAQEWSAHFLQRGSLGLPDPGTPLGLCGHPCEPSKQASEVLFNLHFPEEES